MKKILQLFFWVLFTPAFLFAQSQNNALKVTTLTLDNGLTVLLNEDHSMPEVMGAVAVKAGSKYDPANATGMGHYLEHMLFKGTTDFGTTDYEKEKPVLDEINRLYDELGKTTDEKQREEIQKKINDKSVEAAKYAVPNEMDRLLKSFGSKGVNAFTSWEMIVYHNSFPGHQMEKWLDLYAHRFENPVFRLFQSELEVVYEEKNKSADNFGTQLFETYLKAFFKNHPYGTQTTIGTTEHLKNPSLTKMYEYYNTYYVPNNMALVLSGNFNTEEVIPLIKAKFGVWKSKPVPKFPEYKEEPFKGRELISKRLTPVKLGIMGFRTVPDNHPDKEALEICNYLLSNQNETGLLDELRLNKKLQMAQSIPLFLQDHGGAVILFLPKIVGQSLSSAEKNVLGALDKLKKGDFNEQMLIAARNNLQKDFYKQLEDPKNRAFFIVETFIQNQQWDSFLAYPQRVQKVTMADVKRVAEKYYGPNYLVLFSKMGMPKKDNLKKPGFKPMAGRDSVKSIYAQKFEQIPAGQPTMSFVDFNKDVFTAGLPNGSVLYATKNPVNELFELKIKYKTSIAQQPLLPYAAQYYQNIGTTNKTARDFKQQMSILGCTYSFIADENDGLVITIEGIEQNMQQALGMIRELLQNPAIDENSLSVVLNDDKANRKLETGDPSAINELMQNFIMYGENSPYLKRPSKAELKKLEPRVLIDQMSEATKYMASVHYSGKFPSRRVQGILQRQYIWADEAKPPVMPYYTMRKNYNEPVIYFLNRKDARQSHLTFFANGKAFNKDESAYINAFNSYFGGDMSSLVFQEIREFRSLAYTSNFVVRKPTHGAEKLYLQGYIGCQGDKTIDALKAMMELVRNMPEKTDRITAIQSGLKDAAYANRPNFRDLTEAVETWKEMGYEQDPNLLLIPTYGHLNFNDILKYYKENVQPVPLAIGIVGNKKIVDMKELEKYGKVVIINENDIRKK